MTLLRLLLLALCLAGVVLGVASRRCCPDDEVVLTKGRHCSITTNHTLLECPRGRFMLDPNRFPERDNFTVLENGTLVQNLHAYAEEDGFCLTRLVYRNDTTSKEEIAFVCFPDKDEESELEDASKARRHTTMGVLMMISVFFMLLVLFVYALLPEMRDLEGKCLVSYVSSLCVAFAILGVLQFVGSAITSGRWCATIAFFEYFWMLSAFFWLFVVSFNLWRTVTYGSPTTCSATRMYGLYSVCGWGCPLVFLVAALAFEFMPGHLELIRPNFGQTSCWFQGELETWSFFYGPVAVLLCCNIAFFACTAWKLWRECRNEAATTLASMRFKCVLYLKVFVVMGITWVFELVSAAVDPHGTSLFWYATDILNALQGVLIFVITVACRKRVLRGLSQRRACGVDWPKRWAAGVDAESHAILPDDDVEMTPPNGEHKILS